LAEANSKRESRWSEEKRASFRRVMRPIQIGAPAIGVVELLFLYSGSFLGFPFSLTLGLIIVSFGVYVWFVFRKAFSEYRKWQREWHDRP